VVQRIGRDVDHSPSYSAEVKNEWSHTSLSPTRLDGVDRDIFSFYLLESLVLLPDKYVLFWWVYICGLCRHVQLPHYRILCANIVIVVLI
jgi:hypothetical protein